MFISSMRICKVLTKLQKSASLMPAFPVTPTASSSFSQAPTSTRYAMVPTGPESQTMLSSASIPTSPSAISSIIRSIPPIFRVVCPFSLTGLACPIKACQMRKLCPKFNHSSGKNVCKNKNGCRHIHERPTCLGEAEGTGCAYAGGPEVGNGKGKGKMSDWESARKEHYKTLVHHNRCGVEEWRLRMMMAGLREAHVKGMFT